MHRNAQKCTEMHRNAQKCTEMGFTMDSKVRIKTDNNRLKKSNT